MNDLTKNILLWVVIVLVLLAVFSRYMPTVGQPEEVRYSTFLDDVKSNRVDSVVLQGEMIYGARKDKTQFKTFNPETDYTALIGALQKANVAIEGRPPKQPNFLAQLLLQLAPALLLILVFVYMLRQMQGASGGRGLNFLIFFFTSKFQETSVARSRIKGNAFIGWIVTGSSSGNSSNRVSRPTLLNRAA